MLWNKAVFCLEVVIYKRLQMWRHNDVIGRNEYLISTWSESTVHCNFCLNLQITHGDMEENVNGCFFSEHSVVNNSPVSRGLNGSSFHVRGPAAAKEQSPKVLFWRGTWQTRRDLRNIIGPVSTTARILASISVC